MIGMRRAAKMAMRVAWKIFGNVTVATLSGPG